MSNLFCWKSKWTQNVDIVWCVLDSISQGGKVLKSWKTWRIFCTSWKSPKTWRIFCTSWHSGILSSGTVCRVPINIASPALFIIKQKCHRTNEQAQTYFCALLFPEKYFSSWEWCCFVWERLVGLVSLKPWRKKPDSLHDFSLHINEKKTQKTTWRQLGFHSLPINIGTTILGLIQVWPFLLDFHPILP